MDAPPKNRGAIGIVSPEMMEAGKPTRFVPGGTHGRPRGSRDKLGRVFIDALSKDFDKHGAEAIVQCRERDPLGYIKVVASLLPKELEFKKPVSDLTDDELANAIDILRATIAEPVGGADVGAAEEASGKQAAGLPRVH